MINDLATNESAAKQMCGGRCHLGSSSRLPEMYTPSIILRVSCIVLLWAAVARGADYEDLQKPEEDVPLKLVAGIPYGSISGRVAEYFATLRTPLRREQYDNYDRKDSDLNRVYEEQLDSNN